MGNTNTYTANLAPDLIAKASFDPGYGHYEIKAVGRFFRARVGQTSSTTGTNDTTYGGGIGAAAILPILPKKVDFIAQGMVGRGIGRYGDSSDTANGDVTYRPNGSLSPLKNVQVAGRLRSASDTETRLYLYGGDEYLGRDILRNNVGLWTYNRKHHGLLRFQRHPCQHHLRSHHEEHASGYRRVLVQLL